MECRSGTLLVFRLFFAFRHLTELFRVFIDDDKLELSRSFKTMIAQ
jgi:hypothetical protein